MIRQYVSGLFGNGGTSEEGQYQCQCCGTRFGCQRQVCPACHCFRIERADW